MRIICHAHYDAAVIIKRYNYLLGIPIVILSTLVGTSLFASLNYSPNNWIKIVFGLVSILVALLASLQTFLKFAERSEKHRESGALFGSLLKEVEQKSFTEFDNETEFNEWCNNFRERWDDLSIKSLTIPPNIWKNYRNFLATL